MRSKNPRRQAAYMLDQMRAFRGLYYTARRMDLEPQTTEALRAAWRHFSMDAASRRRAFEEWRERHRATVARLPRLP